MDRLQATLFILEQTGLDVVDLQGRLRTETRALVDPLVEIDAVAATETRIVTALRAQLVAVRGARAAGGRRAVSVGGAWAR